MEQPQRGLRNEKETLKKTSLILAFDDKAIMQHIIYCIYFFLFLANSRPENSPFKSTNKFYFAG